MKRLSLLELLLYWDKNPRWRIALLRIGLIEDTEGHESSLLEIGVYEQEWLFDVLWFSAALRALKNWKENRE